MTNALPQQPLVMAIFPNTRGFGYAVFEGIFMPVDWGMKDARDDKNARCLKEIKLLIQFFRPSIIVLQDCTVPLSRCSKRIASLIRSITELALNEDVVVKLYSRRDIRTCFANYGARSKDEIARAIAKIMPEFAPRVPPMRRLWMSEDYRMGMFDAVALAFTYYHREQLREA